MPMVAGDADSNTGLAGVIFTHLKTVPGANADGSDSPMAQFSNELAAAIVSYVTANATVLPLAMVAGSVPVTGTGTVT